MTVFKVWMNICLDNLFYSLLHNHTLNSLVIVQTISLEEIWDQLEQHSTGPCDAQNPVSSRLQINIIYIKNCKNT